MSDRAQRIEVFNDTQDWIKNDPALSASIPVAKKNTTVFYEDDYPAFDFSKTRDTVITVSGDRSYQAAMKLHRENPDAKIAVMNFANAFHAGGGVTNGASAQEECLCRTSTLYPLLYRRTLRDSFYKHHHDLNTPKATDSLVYTEGVIICKTDEDLPKRMPQEDWVTVDVITIAAPDLRDKSNVHVPLVNGGTYMNNAELFGYHVKRAIHMLTCAAAKGADILVLGAFGCGAFQNDPEVVARAYKIVLQEFPKVFKQIEFAVYCPPSGSRNYDVFKSALGDGNSQKFENKPKNSVFAKLTGLLEELKGDEYGTIHHSEGHKGTMDDPIPWPYITYSEAVHKLIEAVYDFDKENPEYNLKSYLETIEKAGIKNIDEVEPEKLDSYQTMAALMGIVRQERFCDGLILSCLENGVVQKLLMRLKDIDAGVSPKNSKKDMSKIELLHASCADQKVDAVVNAANRRLAEGGGICGVIFGKAGSNELAKACSKYNTPLNDGDAVITPAFNLKNAKAIIHAVGPNFGATPDAFEELFKAYYNSLTVLKDNGYHSISFPLISSSIFGGKLENPVAESTKQCVKAYKKFVEDYPSYQVNVKLCAFTSSEMEKAQKEFDIQMEK